MAEQQIPIVLIEDEKHQARAIRAALETAIATAEKDRDEKAKTDRDDKDESWPFLSAVLLPRSSAQCSYRTMEEFMSSPDRSQVKDRHAFLIVDLFLKEARVDPVSVFHQLMYNLFFPSDTDLSPVCGRLGVLKKLIERYPDTHVEIFSYFITYFNRQNETVKGDRDNFLYSKLKPVDIRNRISKHRSKFEEFLNQHKDSAQEQEGAVNLMQVLALRDALYERISGILGTQNLFEHVTPSSMPSERVPISQKTDFLGQDVQKLVEKIRKHLKKEIACRS